MTPSEFESKWRGIFHAMRQRPAMQEISVPVAKMPLPWQEAQKVTITRAVCRFYHTRFAMLQGSSALPDVAAARRVLCCILCRELGFSATYVGAYLHKSAKHVQGYAAQGQLPQYQRVIHKILTDAGVNDGDRDDGVSALPQGPS